MVRYREISLALTFMVPSWHAILNSQTFSCHARWASR